jgi:hypothetical protein
MGVKGKKDDKSGPGDNFMDQKSALIERYKRIKGYTKQRNDLQAAGKEPRQVVILTQKIRNELGDLKTDFKKLSDTLKEETSKKKTKFTPEELDLRKEILADLASKVEELSNYTSRTGGGNAIGGGFVPSSTFTPSIATFIAEDDDDSKFGGPSNIGGPKNKFVRDSEMSAVEKQGLAQIEANRLEEEKVLDLIGNEMKDLKEIGRKSHLVQQILSCIL